MEETTKTSGESKKAENQDENKIIFALESPYKFDGKEIETIDMSGLTEITAADLCDIDMQMTRKGYSGIRTELTRQYAMYVAARVNHKPWEFCDRMSGRDSIRLKDMVSAFFYARG